MNWILFNLFVVAMLAVDLLLVHKKDHKIKIGEALIWSAIWIAVALVFNAGVYFVSGTTTALQFLTGYILEKSLSVDNLFVFLLIFTFFQVPSLYQHRVLFWGILGALVMRAVFIFCGVALLHTFHWMVYLLGVLLIFTGIHLFFEKDKEVHPEKNPILKLFRKLMPVAPNYHGNKFFIRDQGRIYATPLLIVLLAVETTDIIFAMDSIPAILAITDDPFIVYSSNVFAIIGLRALYFALAGLMQLLHYLHYGLGAILVFVGIKMMISEFYQIPVGIALGVIAGILGISAAASILWPAKEKT
ncbi:MAG: hypothetical protein A3G87_03555 [Omnitrophica bacterium RIFCSPLOWO2_12_FULL_50_11]|nr:MAG: hypothetical protein A3G87_03555 [Omnitrophica bacterium RIFCSPLOWO2_12_FULL_50_11]